jgi:membrane fusion protein (multidrug efflux system)
MSKIILLIGLAAFVSFTSCKEKIEEKSEPGKYTITSPLLMDTSFTKDYVAQIQSFQNIEIRAKIDGYIETIHIDEGQLVKKGQLLFSIRPLQAQAELKKAKAEAAKAEVELTNVKKLAEKNIVSQSELAMAVAKLEGAKAEVSLAEVELSYANVYAPFDGVIDRIKFKVGSLIDEGTMLTSLSNNKEMYAYFNVSEIEYLDYKNRKDSKDKDAVTLLLANGQAHKYVGNIQNIEGEFDNSIGNIAFRAKFPNPEYLLKHGETGKVQITIDLKNALLIPQKATYEVQDKVYVFVVDKNNVVKSRNIIVKQKLSNIYVIEKGLSIDDKILLEGVQVVNEDDKIQSEYVAPLEVMAGLQLIKQ